MAITKPDMEFIWASGGAVVEPSDAKKQLGWTAEVPPHQWENWIQKRQDQYLAHINERGIPEWDSNTNYLAAGKSYVQGSDGKIYKSVAASGPSTTVQNPTSDVSDTYWTVAFADIGAFLTQTSGDARYLQILNNGSDINNAVTFRSNIGAAPTVSPNFTGTPTAPTAAIGTNTTQLATTAFVVSNTIGSGQTMQDVTGSRTSGTTYTNSTGRTIAVFVSVAASSSGETNSVVVGGVTIHTGDAGTAGVFQLWSFLVPPGATYSVTVSPATISKWAEIR